MGDIQDRQTFCRVAELTSFSAAARDLGLPTATVSVSVRRIESLLGVRLLERTTRKVSVTEAGRRYYDRVSPILEDLSDVESATKSGRGITAGRVRIAAPTHLAQALLVAGLPAFVTNYPNICLDFTLSDSAADIVAENVDISLRIGTAP